MMITIQLITTTHPLFNVERELRNEILRRPLNLPDNSWGDFDETSWHFIALENSVVIGCVVLSPLEGGKAQLRQMAVATSYQRKGVGTLLVKSLVQFCKKKGIPEITCHARSIAVPFYQRLGFKIDGEGFLEIGIPHYNMKSEINSQNPE